MKVYLDDCMADPWLLACCLITILWLCYDAGIEHGMDLAEQARAQVLKEEGHRATSIWDMVQGITAVARGYQNQDNRLELEMKAGKFMSKISTN